MTTSPRSAADGVRPAVGEGCSGCSGRPPKRLRRLARSPGGGEGSRCILALAFRGRRGASARVYERPKAISRTSEELGGGRPEVADGSAAALRVPGFVALVVPRDQ